MYYREGFLNGAYESKIFTVDEVVKVFSSSFGLPLWVDMPLLSYDDSEIHGDTAFISVSTARFLKSNISICCDVSRYKCYGI